jgi:hypothetical protein
MHRQPLAQRRLVRVEQLVISSSGTSSERSRLIASARRACARA